jgi:uncharacterized protein YehS (DUF1456 family)
MNELANILFKNKCAKLERENVELRTHLQLMVSLFAKNHDVGQQDCPKCQAIKYAEALVAGKEGKGE